MKVVLLQDVKNLGKRLDIVEVSDGYAKNYLIPKNLAKVATSQSIAEALSKKQSIDYKKHTDIEEANLLKLEIEKIVIEFRLKSYENGKLFGSITSKEITDELEKKLNKKFDKRKICIENIKKAGEYDAKVKIYESVIANLKIKVLGI